MTGQSAMIGAALKRLFALPGLAATAALAGLVAAPAAAQSYRETTVSYDAQGLPVETRIVNPGGSDIVTSYGWNARGDLVSVTDPNGVETTAGYDDARRLTGVIRNPGGSTRETTEVRYTYDPNGRPTVFEQRSGPGASDFFVTTVSYDANGRAGSVTDPDGDVIGFAYNALRLLETVTDGSGRVTRHDYDQLSRRFCERRGFGTSGETTYQALTYSRYGDLASYNPGRSDPDHDCANIDPSYQTTVSHDAYGRPVRTTFADGTFEETALDAAGNVTQRVNRAGDVHVFSYDASNRLTRRSTLERVETFGYDLTGARVCAEVWPAGASATACGTGSPVHRQASVYDFAGRMTSESVTRDGLTRTVGYEYDANGNRTRITWPDGYYVDYQYDRLNRMRFARENGAQVLSHWYWNEYDGRLHNSYRGGTWWGDGSSRAYIYHGWEDDGDLAWQRLYYRGIGSASRQFDYDYDGAGRLISDARPSGWLWTPTVSRSANYGAANVLDQYTLVDGAPASYDLRGNRETWNGLTTTHDSDNRLVRAQSPGLDVAYLYDADGRRVGKDFAAGGADVFFLHAGDMEIAEYDAAGILLRRYVPGAGVDDRVAMVEADGTRHYYIPDRLGTVIGMVDDAGALTDQYLYSPFGVEEPLAASGNPFRYTGRRYDPETGLYYYRARYYDADWGRFLETDPVLYADQMNLYAYVGNDPLNATDPSGETAMALCLAGPIACAVGTTITVATVVACAVTCDDIVEAATGNSDGTIIGDTIFTPVPIPEFPNAITADQLPDGVPDVAPDGAPVRPYPGGRGRPMQGEPGTWVVGPRGDRRFGEDGLPDRDVDWAHDHGQGRPHTTPWGRDSDGNPVRLPEQTRPSTDDERGVSEGGRDPETGRIDDY